MGFYYSLDVLKKHTDNGSRIPNDLSIMLTKISEKTRFIKNTEKITKTTTIFKILNQIIPDEYFGTSNNRKQFYYVVKRILTQSRHECIYKSFVTKGYDLNNIQWLQPISKLEQKNILMRSIILILDNFVKPLILFYFKPLQTLKSHEVIFYPRFKYQSFERQAFNHCLTFKYIIFNRKFVMSQNRGRLIFCPKIQNNDFRPIVKFNQNFKSIKLLVPKIYNAARFIEKDSSQPLYNAWVKYSEITKGKRIFAVKLDIRDAFGSIDIKLLATIVNSVPDKYLNNREKRRIIYHIKYQCISIYRDKGQRLLWQWKHGLIQGDPLSTPLCELYMAYMNKDFLHHFQEDYFFHKTVDDYFFCSVDENSSYNFLTKIKGIYNLNETKTMTNFISPESNVIPYCGKLFNLDTKEVKKLYSLSSSDMSNRFSIRNKFKLFNIKRQISERNGSKFLRNAMEYAYSSNNFSKVELNTVYNSEKVCLENHFEGMILLAYKFDVAFMIMRDVHENMDFALIVLKKTINKFSLKTLDRLRTHKGLYDQGNITLKLLLDISYKAFVMVLKRRYKVYQQFLESIYNPKFIDFREASVDKSYFFRIPGHFQKLRMSRKV